jgi:hypothetical protein
MKWQMTYCSQPQCRIYLFYAKVEPAHGHNVDWVSNNAVQVADLVVFNLPSSYGVFYSSRLCQNSLCSPEYVVMPSIAMACRAWRHICRNLWPFMSSRLTFFWYVQPVA